MLIERERGGEINCKINIDSSEENCKTNSNIDRVSTCEVIAINHHCSFLDSDTCSIPANPSPLSPY